MYPSLTDPSIWVFPVIIVIVILMAGVIARYTDIRREILRVLSDEVIACHEAVIFQKFQLRWTPDLVIRFVLNHLKDSGIIVQHTISPSVINEMADHGIPPVFYQLTIKGKLAAYYALR